MCFGESCEHCDGDMINISRSFKQPIQIYVCVGCGNAQIIKDGGMEMLEAKASSKYFKKLREESL